MTDAAFPSIEAFYAARGGAVSGECDFGVLWTAETRWPGHRVSVVHATGDVYAVDHRGAVRLLGTVTTGGQSLCEPGSEIVCPYQEAEDALTGWTEHINDDNSLDWIRARLGER